MIACVPRQLDAHRAALDGHYFSDKELTIIGRAIRTTSS